MTAYNNIKAYKTAYMNVDKINQIIMLFEKAMISIQQAKQAITDKKVEERFNTLSKAFKILTGLRDSLDHDKGGELAGILADWYSGTAYRIMSINRSQDLNMCDMCIKHIKEMRDAWVEVEKQVKSGSTSDNSSESADEVSSTQDKKDFFDTIAKAAVGGGGMSISI